MRNPEEEHMGSEGFKCSGKVPGILTGSAPPFFAQGTRVDGKSQIWPEVYVGLAEIKACC